MPERAKTPGGQECGRERERKCAPKGAMRREDRLEGGMPKEGGCVRVKKALRLLRERMRAGVNASVERREVQTGVRVR